MRFGLLRSVKWLGNHGVMVRFSGGGHRFAPPNGTLTVLEASRLLGVGEMRLYRMERRGLIRFQHGPRGVTVGLDQVRKAARLVGK